MPRLQQLVGHLRRQGRVAEHHRQDRVLARLDREARPLQAGAQLLRVGVQPVAQVAAAGRPVPAPSAPPCTIGGGTRVREQVRPRALPQEVDDLRLRRR